MRRSRHTSIKRGVPRLAARRSPMTYRDLALAMALGAASSFGLPPPGAFAQATAAGPPPGHHAAAPRRATEPPPPPPENRANRPLADPIVERIKYLHDRLRITAAQEPLWAKVAEVMRENATTLAPLIKDRVQSAAARLGDRDAPILHEARAKRNSTISRSSSTRFRRFITASPRPRRRSRIPSSASVHWP